MNNYEFKFSVIMPIYNIEKYLKEAVDSVINQTIGFKNSIQIIFVNDGSPDNSEQICLEYQKKYPNNIVYIKQKNQGVSQTRNNGVEYVKGKYTNFFDGDDIWTKNSFELAYKMFEKNYDDIDIVACRQKYFELKKSYQALDYKFNDGNQIVDINEKPNYLQMSVTSAFIKSEVLKNYSFDKDLKYAEDAKYITQILLDKQKYGLLKDALYYIRKREDDTSATQNKLKLVTSYTDTIEKYYKFIYDYSMKKYKKLHPYIEHALVNSLKYRAISKIPENIPKDVVKKYTKEIISMLKTVSDDAIINTGKINLDTRMCLLDIKNNGVKEKDISYEQGFLKYKNKPVQELNTKSSLYIDNMTIKNNKCYLKGIFKTNLYTNIDKLYIDMVGKKYSINLKENEEKERYSFTGKKVNIVNDFEVNIDLTGNYSRLMFYYVYNEDIFKLRVNFSNDCKYKNINRKPRKIGNYSVYKTKDHKLVIEKPNIKIFMRKLNFLTRKVIKSLIRKKQIKHVIISKVKNSYKR